MSGFDDLRASLENVLYNNWTDTPVAYENVPFTIPDGPWVRLQINNAEGQTKGLSGDTNSVEVWDSGVISVQVFVKEGTGTKKSLELVDGIVALYEHQRFGDILTYSASARPAGVNDGWHQRNITVPFRRSR